MRRRTRRILITVAAAALGVPTATYGIVDYVARTQAQVLATAVWHAAAADPAAAASDPLSVAGVAGDAMLTSLTADGYAGLRDAIRAGVPERQWAVDISPCSVPGQQRVTVTRLAWPQVSATHECGDVVAAVIAST